MNNFKQLHKDFPILSQKIDNNPLIYFDNAATTQKPQSVIDALVHFYTTCNANIYRGIHTLAEAATQLYEDARTKVALFIGAFPEEIIFTSGTTEGINFIASTWAEQHINAGDEIVITQLEHHANLLPWQQLVKKKGAMLRCIPVLQDGTLDMSLLDDIITHKTKLVAVVHVSNAVGTHNDIIVIANRAHSVGARILIDAAQSIAHQKIDVTQLNCDFLVFSGHKLMAPTGIGVLFIKKELHDQMPPYRFGGGMVEHADFLHATWRKAPQKFEAGTPAIAQAIGLGAAIDYINKNINFSDLVQHEARLCAQLIDGLLAFPEITLLGPLSQLKQNGHLVSFFVKNIHSHDVAAFLNSRGIAVRAGHHCAQPFATALGYDSSVRVSFYFYNTQEEVEYFLRNIYTLFS
jgi:cysteine desulfurase/selenocysteine lyase